MKDSLTLLKVRLLLQALDRVPNSERHALVIQEVRVACELAERTPFPALLLPCLIEERVQLALEFARQREQGYWGRLGLTGTELALEVRPVILSMPAPDSP
ncbi:MAG TPA: hypothetical protein VL793_15470 [Patescibacteria group bacterium]|nr:hypothetical protein [Patescibacteria group bacterium]